MKETTMLKANRAANAREMEYATSADFCRIFDNDMSSLYLLSLLLTGDESKAEQCFVAGLENAVNRNRVFKEWARSWARRVIIQNALRIMNPRLNDKTSVVRSVTPGVNGNTLNGNTPTQPVEVRAVLGLPSFDRFVFVMSVLEHYSDLDCSLLLGCTRRDVLAARIRALEQIGSAAESLLARPEGVGHGCASRAPLSTVSFASPEPHFALRA